jgi:hypothetical protein
MEEPLFCLELEGVPDPPVKESPGDESPILAAVEKKEDPDCRDMVLDSLESIWEICRCTPFERYPGCKCQESGWDSY